MFNNWIEYQSFNLNLNKMKLKIQFPSCPSYISSAQWPHVVSGSVSNSTGPGQPLPVVLEVVPLAMCWDCSSSLHPEYVELQALGEPGECWRTASQPPEWAESLRHLGTWYLPSSFSTAVQSWWRWARGLVGCERPTQRDCIPGGWAWPWDEPNRMT